MMEQSDSPKLATTFQSGFRTEPFRKLATMIRVPDRLDELPRKSFKPSDELTLLWRVLSAARNHETLLLFSSRGYLKPELTACLLLGLLPSRYRPTLIVYGEMFQPSTGLVGGMERRFMWLLRRVVDQFIVFSEDERLSFSEAWDMPLDKVKSCLAFVPSIEEEEDGVADPDPAFVREVLEATGVAGRRYVFAGGSSFRDYGPLLEAARRLPDIAFVISSPGIGDRVDLPPNVHPGSLERPFYRALLHAAHAVVVPLQIDVSRASGLFTYLRSMELAKPTIVSNSLATSEYIEHGKTGWVVKPEPEAYAETISHVFDPAASKEVECVGHRAQRAVRETFTLEAFVDRLMPLVLEAGTRSR